MGDDIANYDLAESLERPMSGGDEKKASVVDDSDDDDEREDDGEVVLTGPLMRTDQEPEPEVAPCHSTPETGEDSPPAPFELVDPSAPSPDETTHLAHTAPPPSRDDEPRVAQGGRQPKGDLDVGAPPTACDAETKDDIRRGITKGGNASGDRGHLYRRGPMLTPWRQSRDARKRAEHDGHTRIDSSSAGSTDAFSDGKQHVQPGRRGMHRRARVKPGSSRLQRPEWRQRQKEERSPSEMTHKEGN